MTHYQQAIKPGMVRHPEWKKLDQRIVDLTKKLEDAKTERANWENGYVMRSYYPTSAD